MKKIYYLIIALLSMVAQGAWAQTSVATEDELNSAINNNGAKVNIKLTADIALTDYVNIPEDKDVTLDLNGHTLDRGLSELIAYGNVIRVEVDADLIIKDSAGGGTITGGYDSCGGSICTYGNVTFEGGTITGCQSTTGGAVYVVSGGKFTMTGGTITDCSATSDGGAIYNLGTVNIEGGTIKDNAANGESGSAGGGIWNASSSTLTISGGTFTGNECKGNGGAINIHGDANISGVTITGNSAGDHAGGIYIDASDKTIKMSGLIVIKNNTANEATGNVWIYSSSTVITCAAAFEDGTSIGIDRRESDYNKKFTSGFSSKNGSVEPGDFFTADISGATFSLSSGEAYLSTNSGVFYIERSWTGGDTDGHVVSTKKIATGVSSFSGAESVFSGWYLIEGSKKYDDERVAVSGDVHFILQDGCNLELTKGIYIKKGSHLYIHCQEGESGILRCTGGDGDNAAIGGNGDSNQGGKLTVYGGYIKATANSNNAAGIGGGNHSESGMQAVTIYGGTVQAWGESSAAGIGGGQQNNTDKQPVVRIYGGEVRAESEQYGAGIGGGEDRGGNQVYIYGGIVTAQGGKYGAGIGGGQEGTTGTVVIYGGTVTATGGYCGAGIGGGEYKGSGTVTVYGGTVSATGGEKAAGIGGGDNGTGADVYIYGGTITAKTGKSDNSKAIGGGNDAGSQGSITLGDDIQVRTGDSSGSLVGTSSRVSTLQSNGQRTTMTCSHPNGLTASDKDDYYHHYNCSYCEGYDEAHEKGSDGRCITCGRGLPSRTFTFYESKSNGKGYASKGTAYYVTEESEFTFPECSTVPDGKMFVGWELCDETPSSINIDGTDNLVKAGTTVTLEAFSSDRNYYARYMNGVFSGGNGSEADPFLISTTDDFSELESAISSKGHDFKDIYLAVTADIDFSGVTFTPIGTSTTNFNGTFDGQGHTIKGVAIDKKSDYQGLFSYIGANGTVKNLTLDNSSIKGASQTGAIAGRSQGTVENCHVTNSVTVEAYATDADGNRTSYIAGLVGYNKGTLEGCTSEATVSASDSYRVGGIAGYGGGTLKNNLFLGSSLTGGKYVGAIVGQDYSTSMTFCYYVPADGLPKAVGSSSSSKDKSGAKAGYSVSSGTEGLTLSYGETTAIYDNEGIEAYSFGLLYGDKLYAASGASVNFNAVTSDGKTAANVKASAGTLAANEDDSYTLVMTSSNAVITAEMEDVTIVSFSDIDNNAVVLAQYDGENVDVEYDRELTTGENGESTAYTVCLPYDYDAEDYTEDDEEEDEDEDEDDQAAGARHRAAAYDAVVKVFTLAAVDNENKQFIFTDAPSYLPAGTPVVIVVYQGSLWLNAEGVILNATMPENAHPVYASFPDYLAQNDNIVGFWNGSYETFRAFFEAIDTADVGSYEPMYQPSDGGELQPFPADRFDDEYVKGIGTGIMEVKNGSVNTEKWYSIDGRMLNGKPAQKGIYIINGKKVMK